MFDVRDLNQYPPRFNVNDTVYVYRMTPYGGRIYQGTILEVINANGTYEVDTIDEHIELDLFKVMWKDNMGRNQEDLIHSYELLTEDQADEKKETLDYYYNNRD